MTTTPAMPELPEPFALSVSVHEGDTPAKTYVECMLYQKHPNEKQRLYTADQMRAYALATLQAQQSTQGDTPAAAEVSDVVAMVRERYRGTKWGKAAECICDAVDEAILALRPQSESEQEKELRRSLAEAQATISERNAEIIELQKRIRRSPQAVPMTRMLSREELAGCCGGCASNSAIETWMRRAIEKFCEVNGITAPAGGEG